MGRVLFSVLLVVTTVGCTAHDGRVKEGKKVKPLSIRWQRLVDEYGQTCERCRATGQELQKAFNVLKASLAPLGVGVTMETTALDPATCAGNVSQSNRIWISDRPLEDWLGAEVGESPCATCCEKLGTDVECRTFVLGGKTHEEIPAELIIKAGLLAASQQIEAAGDLPCCGSDTSAERAAGGCNRDPGGCR